MSDRYFMHTFDNGLTLLGEKMPGVQSAAMLLLLPAGVSTDPPERCGLGSVLADLALRGAGDRDNRQLTDYLDSLGLQRGGGVGIHHTRFSAAGLASRVVTGIATYADIVRRPHLPEDGFESARDLALQALAGIDDEPSKILGVELRRWALPSPYGRNNKGEAAHLKQLSLDDCKRDFTARYQPQGAIISIAGNIDFEQIKAEVGEHFGSWEAKETPPLVLTPPPGNRYHQTHASEQTHIGIAYPAISESHPDYYALMLALEVLSGGMSSRLFTEIREKRALVYSVSARYSGLKNVAGVFGYAGTSNERAQETIDQFVAELYRLSEGVTAAELARAKTALKSGVIMQGESTSARCGAIAHDFFMRGRLRTLEEVKAAVEGVTLDQVNNFLKKNKAGPFTFVTVGPKELKLPE